MVNGRDIVVADLWRGEIGDEGALKDPEAGMPPMALRRWKRSLGRMMWSTGRQRAWKRPSGSLGVRRVVRAGKPPASMLRARMSSASLVVLGWLVMSQ